MGGAAVTTNRLGMRDREYEEVKPPDTYRIVLLGTSHDQGTGVRDDETYENIVEDRLNRECPDSHYSRYEILNLSVGGDSLLQRVLRLEHKGFDFQPDAVLFSVAAADQQFLAAHLRQALILGIEPPPDYREVVESVFRRAHVSRTMPAVLIERRLQSYLAEISEWAFRRFAQQCAQRGLRALVIYRPAPADFEGTEATIRNETVRIARAAGLDVIDLSPAFDPITDRGTLMIAKWDHHTTALGHRLLADKLYEKLVPLLFGSPSSQQVSRVQKP
jgi:hypothetical protein